MNSEFVMCCYVSGMVSDLCCYLERVLSDEQKKEVIQLVKDCYGKDFEKFKKEYESKFITDLNK